MPRVRRGPVGGPYLENLQLVREWVPGYDRYPFCLPAVKHLDVLTFHPKVTFFVGENGSGKSTVLEAIAVNNGLNPEGGSRNFDFSTRESHSGLYKTIRLGRTGRLSDAYFLRAESFFNVASEVERLGAQQYYGGKSLHEQSHGESFFALFEHRMSGPGLYFLDEPEAALSPSRQLQFLALLHERCRGGSQFVIATHSPIILAYPEATIYSFGGDGLKPIAYEDTEHYRTTLTFLRNPGRVLAALLDYDEPYE